MLFTLSFWKILKPPEYWRFARRGWTRRRVRAQFFENVGPVRSHLGENSVHAALERSVAIELEDDVLAEGVFELAHVVGRGGDVDPVTKEGGDLLRSAERGDPHRGRVEPRDLDRALHVVESRAQHHQPLNLPRLRVDRRSAGCAAAHAPANQRNALRSVFFEIPHRRQYIQLQRSTHYVGITRPMRLPIPAKINRQHPKSRRRKLLRLRSPTLFVELAAMRQHHSPRTSSVEIGIHAAAVRSRKRNRSLRPNQARTRNQYKNCGQSQHAATLPPAVI